MKNFDEIFKRFIVLRIFAIFCEHSTRDKHKDESEHCATDDGMKVVHKLFLLALYEAEGTEEPEDKKVCEAQHAESDGHVQEGGRPTVFEYGHDDGNIEEDLPSDGQPHFVDKDLSIGWT